MKWNHKQSAKHVIRHFGYRVGLEQAIYRNMQRKGFITTHLDGTTPAERFSSIYKLGCWMHSKGQQSFSGEGSEMRVTAKLCEALPPLLARLGCRRMVDVGCGDWNWMRNVELPCDYLGVDIVPEVIATNRCYERPGVSFRVADAIAGPLPEADVALCREVLFHLSFEDGRAALINMSKAARWLIATTDPTIWFNSDIRTGDFRNINLQRSPYGLPPPREVVADDAVSRGRILGVWATSDLQVGIQ